MFPNSHDGISRGTRPCTGFESSPRVRYTMRNIFTAGLLLAGVTTAHAQTITPGLGGVAITGQAGAGVYIPWNGAGPVIGAPGVGSYNLNNRSYTSPFSWSQYSNPTAYNFNTGSFNYNSGMYGWNNGLTPANYYGSPYANGNVILNSGYTYPGSVFNGGYSSPWVGTSLGTNVVTPFLNTGGRGRMRLRLR